MAVGGEDRRGEARRVDIEPLLQTGEKLANTWFLSNFCGEGISSFPFLLILYIPFGLRSRGFHRFMIECTTFKFMLAFHGLRSSAIHRNLSPHIDSGHISSHSCRGYLLSVLCSAISLTFLVCSTYVV